MTSKAKLLIVDDTPENLRVLSELLRGDYHLQVATSGERALQLIAKSLPDVVLLDVMMPEMDGYEVCSRIKSHPEWRQCVVIFVTALSSEEDEQRGLSLGAVDYVTKPFRPALIKARLHNHVELKRHRDFLEQEVARRSQALLEAELTNQRLEADLQLAHKLQMSMLPPSRWNHADWQLAAHLEPARAVGGDFYDYRFGSTLWIWVGDVSDKGTAAALFMVKCMTLLRESLERANHPGDLLDLLNRALCQDNPNCMFVTLAVAQIDLQSGRVQYAHGGHEPMLLTYRGYYAAEGGPALGLFEEAEFPRYVLQLEPGENLVLTSDGVADATNVEEIAFGAEGLAQLFPAAGGADTVVRRSLQALREHVRDHTPADDLTILAVRRPCSWRMDFQLENREALLQPKLREVVQALSEAGYSADLCQDLELVLEELLLNTIRYGYPNGEEDLLRISLQGQPGCWVELVVLDTGRPFDPLRACERPDDKVGGWGIPLICGLTDCIQYSFVDGYNRLEIRRAERESQT